MKLNTGINENKREEIAKSLSKLLAETYTLALKTQKYHWNVKGPLFSSLHLMFEGQYNELSTAVDELAERIRVLGVEAPGSYSEFASLSEIKEDSSHGTSANQMVKNLLADHELIARTSKSILSLLDNANDEGTSSLLGARVEIHEKTSWMLASSIEG